MTMGLKLDPEYDPDSTTEYECLDCGYTTQAERHPVSCPDCGSSLRNRAFPIE